MGSPLFDIRKSHLLITELLTNFGRKTEELNRLKTSIDIAWNEIRFGLMFFCFGMDHTVWTVPSYRYSESQILDLDHMVQKVL